MKRFKSILVATDTRFDQQGIIDEAVEIARHNDASLKIVDVVPDLPWTVRLTVKDHVHMSDLMSQETEQRLQAITAAIGAKGVTVEAKVLHGKTSIAIIREVLRNDHDLVVRVHKGKESRRRGFFGNTGIRLLRKCPCAVWLMTPTKTKFQHVLGCIDTSTDDPLDAELNDEVFELAKSISHYHDGYFSIVHAWSVWNELFLQRRMDPVEFEEMVEGARYQVVKTLDNFLRRHDSNAQADNIHVIKAAVPGDAIVEFATSNDADLVVMGTVARSGVSGVVMGNTAEQMLSRIECSVLALKPSSFVCPIQLDD